MAYTSDKEPTQLTALTTMDTADVFVIGDVSDASEVAKYITKANLMADPGAIGGTTPAAGTFSGVTISASGNLDIGGVTILDDTAGTTALQNIDSIDATTEATIEAAIDTLANLTSIQGRTVTLADAGADAIFGWDDSANAYENLTQGEVRAVAGLATTDSPEFTAVNIGNATDTTVSRSAAGIIAVEGVAVPTISSTHTLTNKRVTPRTGSTTSSATPTINTDNVDIYSLTAQTVDITSFTTNLSGTPTHGQSLIIEITGTAARAITWGSSFEASTVALPTTTVSTNMLTVGFKWNSTTSKWRCLASA